jgi:hypothetical protein
MEARTVKHRLATLLAALLCAAPAGAFAQLAGSERSSAQSANTLQEPSLSRPETWLKRRNPPAAAAESAVKAEPAVGPVPAHAEPGSTAQFDSAMPPKSEIGIGPKPDSALLPPNAADTATATRENEDTERSVPRGAREAARDPCLRSSDPKCYERHKDHYHPYLGYVPGTPVSTLAPVGATSVSSAGGAVGARITPASVVPAPAPTATPRTPEQPLVFFDPPPKKHRRGK